MALSYSEIKRDVWGSQIVSMGEVTFDSSYPTSGEAYTASTFKLTKVNWISPASDSNVAGKYAVWDRANSKILLYDEDNISGIAAEAANTSDQSAVVVQVMVFGY